VTHGAESLQYYLIFIQGDAIPHVSLPFDLLLGLQHAYFEFIDPIKEGFASFQPQRVSIVKNLLTAGNLPYYLLFQPQRAPTTKNPLIAGDIHYYPSF